MGTMPCARSRGMSSGAPRETVEADLRTEQVGGAQRDVAAANQQYPDHTRTFVSLRRRAARKPSTDLPMPHQITIKPSEHSFACPDGDTVLAAAMAADLMLPYGCRNGACGTCKGKILEGRVDYGAYQAVDADRRRKGSGPRALLLRASPRPIS